MLCHVRFPCKHEPLTTLTTPLFVLLPSERLRSRLPPYRAHRGEQIQHVRVGRVAPQEETHVCGPQRQRQVYEREENAPEKHCHSLPAHRGTASVIGRLLGALC